MEVCRRNKLIAINDVERVFASANQQLTGGGGSPRQAIPYGIQCCRMRDKGLEHRLVALVAGDRIAGQHPIAGRDVLDSDQPTVGDNRRAGHEAHLVRGIGE